MVDVRIIPFEQAHKPNTDGDVRSLVKRICDVEDKIDAENKLKALIYAEAKLSGVDIAALKSTVRAVRYMPQSGEPHLIGHTTLVKQYLDIVNDVSTAHKKSEN